MFFTFATLAFKLAIPAVYSLFFNRIQGFLSGVGGLNVVSLIWLTALYFTVSVSDGISNAIGDYIISKWWLVSQTDFFKKIYRHITTLSLSFFEENSTGKIRERTWDGSQGMVNIVENTFMTILPQLLFLISAIIVLIFIKPIFALIIVLAVPGFPATAFHFFR